MQLRLLCKYVSSHICSTLRECGKDYSKGLDICFIDGNIGEGKSTALEKFANSGHTVSTENLTQFTKIFQTMSGVGMLQARYENMARIKFLRNRLTKRIQDCYVSSIEDETTFLSCLHLV